MEHGQGDKGIGGGLRHWKVPLLVAQPLAIEGEDVEQLNGRINAKLFNNWYTEIEVEQSLSASETNEANVSLIYLAKCWGLEFQTKYTPEDTRFMVTFSLANLGNPFKVDL